jgi:AcrR family transcriptional regulator
MSKTARQAPRRTQEQRRKQTRERVLSATLKVLREYGHAGFTTTRVAAVAGVSRGAQENHFPTRADLIAAAGRYFIDEDAKHARRMAARARTTHDPLKTFLLDSKHLFLRPNFFAMVELALGGRSEPALADIHKRLFKSSRERLDRIWTDAFCAEGYSRESVKRFLNMTHYIFRGIVLAKLCLPLKPDVNAILADWEAIAPAILVVDLEGKVTESRPPRARRGRRSA